jgi:hypothetical protein
MGINYKKEDSLCGYKVKNTTGEAKNVSCVKCIEILNKETNGNSK